MAVPLLLYRIQWTDLVFAGVPVDMQVLLVVRSVELLVHLLYDLFVGTALEGHALALVVEAEIDVDRHLDTSATRVERSSDYRFGIECRCLARAKLHQLGLFLIGSTLT